MSSAAVLILAVSVSIDAFAVSVGGALCDRTGRCRRNAVNAAAFFGTFQIVMPLIGYFAATLLGSMGLSHEAFDYSKDLFDTVNQPRRFAYYTFNEGFGVVDASGEAVWDCAADRAVSVTSPELLDVGRTLLQTTYVDIDRR